MCRISKTHTLALNMSRILRMELTKRKVTIQHVVYEFKRSIHTPDMKGWLFFGIVTILTFLELTPHTPDCNQPVEGGGEEEKR